MRLQIPPLRSLFGYRLRVTSVGMTGKRVSSKLFNACFDNYEKNEKFNYN